MGSPRSCFVNDLKQMPNEELDAQGVLHESTFSVAKFCKQRATAAGQCVWFIEGVRTLFRKLVRRSRAVHEVTQRHEQLLHFEM